MCELFILCAMYVAANSQEFCARKFSVFMAAKYKGGFSPSETIPFQVLNFRNLQLQPAFCT